MVRGHRVGVRDQSEGCAFLAIMQILFVVFDCRSGAAMEMNDGMVLATMRNFYFPIYIASSCFSFNRKLPCQSSLLGFATGFHCLLLGWILLTRVSLILWQAREIERR